MLQLDSVLKRHSFIYILNSTAAAVDLEDASSCVYVQMDVSEIKGS